SCGEDVVDIHGGIEVVRQLDWVTAEEVVTAGFHQQGHQPLVGRAQSSLEGQKAGRSEVRFADRSGFVAPIEPGQDVLDVIGKPARVRSAIQLAENGAPVPATELALDRVFLEPGTEYGADCR